MLFCLSFVRVDVLNSKYTSAVKKFYFDYSSFSNLFIRDILKGELINGHKIFFELLEPVIRLESKITQPALYYRTLHIT